MSKRLWNLVLFGLAYLINGISTFVGNLIPKQSLYKNGSGTNLPIADRDKKVHAFPEDISPRVNIIEWQELELTDFKAAV